MAFEFPPEEPDRIARHEAPHRRCSPSHMRHGPSHERIMLAGLAQTHNTEGEQGCCGVPGRRDDVIDKRCVTASGAHVLRVNLDGRRALRHAVPRTGDDGPGP